MCGPEALFAAQAAGSLGSALFGAAGDLADYNRKVGAINSEAEALQRSTIFRYQLAGLQERQIQDRATIQVGDTIEKRDEAINMATAAAAGSGVEGNSIDALLRGFAVSTGSDITNLYAQRDAELTQVEMEKKGTFMDAKNRHTALKNEVPDDPSSKMLARFFGAALQTGSAYIQNTTRVDTSKGESGFLGRRFG